MAYPVDVHVMLLTCFRVHLLSLKPGFPQGCGCLLLTQTDHVYQSEYQAGELAVVVVFDRDSKLLKAVTKTKSKTLNSNFNSFAARFPLVLN